MKLLVFASLLALACGQQMTQQQFQSLTSQPNVQQLLGQIPPPLQGTIASFLNNPIRSLQTIASLSRMMNMASTMSSMFGGGGGGMSSMLGGRFPGTRSSPMSYPMGAYGPPYSNGFSPSATVGSSGLNGFNQISGDDGLVESAQVPSGQNQSPMVAALTAPRSKRETSNQDPQYTDTFDSLGLEMVSEHNEPGHKCRPGRK